MRHDGCLIMWFDGDPREWAVRPCALMSTMTMTTKTSRRAAGVM
jgi:hypothetical protein